MRTLKLSSSPNLVKLNFFGLTETDIPAGFLISALYVPGEPTFLSLRVIVIDLERLGTVIEG